MTKEFKNLAEFSEAFRDEEACIRYFEQVRFQNGDYCPHCGHNKIMRFASGKRYRCHSCKQDFTVRTGTMFGESRLPLKKWFTAIYLLTTRKKGISSIELSTQVGVSQRTAWFMDHRIREAMKRGKGLLSGTVEVDETYVGGKHRRQHGFSKKAAVMGMTERGGKIRAYHIEGRETHIVLGKVKENINPKAFIMTDEAGVYKKLPKVGFPKHGSVKHGKRHWAHGDINTNSIESFWALFKRNYHGTYHSMSKKHLQRYIDEVAFRFNNRDEDMSDVFAEVVKRIMKRGNMSYKALTA